jgi:hypothetical protein
MPNTTLPPLIPIAHNIPNPPPRPGLLRGMTVQSIFKPRTGQENRHFWVFPPQNLIQAMFHPGNILAFLDGSIIYRIWLPILFHTSFAAIVVALYWLYHMSIPNLILT